MSCSVNTPRELQFCCSSSEPSTSRLLLPPKGRQRFCVSLPSVDQSQCRPPRSCPDGSWRGFQSPTLSIRIQGTGQYYSIKTYPSQVLSSTSLMINAGLGLEKFSQGIFFFRKSIKCSNFSRKIPLRFFCLIIFSSRKPK